MSTYSPSLRIELITTGTQAGAWGNTTNSNLGGLIESAIAGYVSVSVTSANQAFTALDGAPDQARNQTIALTTITSNVFAVYAPPAEKTYVIYNASAYAATIYNSTVIGNTTAAGAGVIIPAGKTVTVWSDGTNFAFQNDHLPSLTLATDLAIADGGTGASTAPNARTNLGAASSGANSDITSLSGLTSAITIGQGGTGQTTANAAFNALAPAQASQDGRYLKTNGANTSWDLIDVSTNDITGTLPVANGGTGLATTPVNGALDIGNGTGFTRATLTAGSGVTITNSAGGITIAATGAGGTITSVTATAPVASSGGTAPVISLNAAYGDALNPYAAKTANNFLAAPNGFSGVPTFRTIAAADIPTLNQNTTGNAATATVAVDATKISNAGSWSVTPSGTKLFFNYNGTNVGSLDSSGNFIVTGNVTAYGTP